MTVSKILITTGDNDDGHQTTSEIKDLSIKGGNKCINWPDFPISVSQAQGGLIKDTVMICGGRYGGANGEIFDECYSLTAQKATFVTHMSVRRYWAASIVIRNKYLWITGGYDGGGLYLSSTELVNVHGSIAGPDLPLGLVDHAMVAVNYSCSMVIGGHKQGSLIASTYYYDYINDEWTNGPSLIHRRWYHAAGIVTDEVTNENFVAVTGGYNGFYLGTEVLYDVEWVEGKRKDALKNYIVERLLTKCSYHSIITLNRNSLICFG